MSSGAWGGRFVLLDDVGEGGGAVVVRAEDQTFPTRLVAIKLLRANTADARRRFIQEGDVLAEIDHPGIVGVLDRGQDKDDLYMALELISGPDLADHARSGPMPWRDAVEIGVQVANALDTVHRMGLVHRDVKPSNIMLAGSGACIQIKLIDFGVARITENYRAPKGSMPRRPTTTGMALGTRGYQPPEAGLVPANALFDVYGLGATLYELLTGHLLEPLQSPHEDLAACNVPDDLGFVLAAALALEPEDRTQSAAELGRALEAVRTAHPERESSDRLEGRYELIGLIGTGAKADAFLATHRGAGHDVVLKFLRSKDPEEGLRFAREAKLLQAFDHPALPRFYDYSPLAKPPYIVMAHAQGRPAARLCSPPCLKPLEVAAVGLRLAQVVAVMHARGVLHRDINANNVLIDATGAVTVIDLGCAELTQKFYDVPAGEQRYLTPPEARVVIPDGGIGQLMWSAPEVHAGQNWSEKSDVYSMGHLLFRLLTGKVPLKHADPPTSPQKYVRTCPDDFAEAIRTALFVDPSERPSAAEFAATLKDVLDTEEEIREQALAKAMSPGRAALRLVPTPPSDWTQHPVPDSSSGPEAPSLAPAGPPPGAGTPDTHASARHRRLWQAAAVLGAVCTGVVLGLSLAGRRPEREPSAVRVPAHLASTPAPRPMATEPKSPPPEPTLPVPSLPPVHAALDEATVALQQCSALAGGLLIVEYKSPQGADHFDSVAVSGSTNSALDRCVQRATANIRFRPQGSQDFTKEYTP